MLIGDEEDPKIRISPPCTVRARLQSVTIFSPSDDASLLLHLNHTTRVVYNVDGDRCTPSTDSRDFPSKEAQNTLDGNFKYVGGSLQLLAFTG